jgi:hypothetical protein
MKEIGALIWSLLQVLGFFLSIFLVQLPFNVARHLVRWYQLPLWKRNSINERTRCRKEFTYEQVEAAIRAELIAHGLMDTPANRTRINSAMQRRRK